MPKTDWYHRMFDDVYLQVLERQWPRARTRAEADFLQETLKLPKGARILDVPCGYGRHSQELARRGYEVVGVDLSPVMLREARRRWDGRPRLTFERGDMRRLPYRGEFDALCNLFTSFGYFSERENLATLKRFAAALRPGGWIVIDHRNRRFLEKRRFARHWSRLGREWFILDQAAPARKDGVWENDWLILRLGETRVWKRHLRVRNYYLSEWRRMFQDAGLTIDRVFSGYLDTAFRESRDSRMLIVGRKRP